MTPDGHETQAAAAPPAAPRIHRMQVPPNSDLTLGMTCVDKAVPGRCTWRMRADERFANPAGIMQGGFLGAFADSAMGAAAVTYVQGRKVFASNAEMKISFLAPVPPGAALVCRAEVVSGGKRLAFVEASIVATVEGGADPAERLVARATSTYVFRDRDCGNSAQGVCTALVHRPG